MEYVPKHTTDLFFMVLMVKSWWFVMAFVIYLWFICNGVRIFGEGSIVFFSRVCIIVFIYNAFEVILKAVVGLGLFL